MVVETEGLRRWLAREGPARRAREVHRRAQAPARRRRRSWWRRGAGSPRIYASAPDAEAARAQKAAEFARLREALAAGGHPATGELNNARLVAVATYERCVPALRAELERLGNDLPAFYAEMKRLADDRVARARLCPGVIGVRRRELRPAQIRYFGRIASSGCGRMPSRARPLTLQTLSTSERPVVVGRERLAGHEVAHRRLQARGEIRDADDRAREAEAVAHAAHDLAQRQPLGAAELVALAGDALVVERALDGGDDVADPDRREARAGPRERQRRAEWRAAGARTGSRSRRAGRRSPTAGRSSRRGPAPHSSRTMRSPRPLLRR